ncbi:hypothetical protein WYY_12715 [Bacillus velezensis M27]|uniref:hypothetical protein n=1 Tax=Bacillus TaxID=1386 RepID=UPI000241604D|nr:MULTISPECIES: hypothetical protein [Bacillus amyloliquefaciens group]AGF27990.1 hypothetical protein KSO_012505 [Bacillus amyloliquefaciens IT-45]ASF54899.1 hypothetical protein CEG11_07235 [Bacillus velezensis]EKE47145.1 hypothetical protein WYY_12715 [Bacillus velezensis M27]ERK84105.1 hypothetical protein N786_07695 [Bacillus amyloliquefaciens UASWS BA1]MBH5313879.1 hypothetical protein [Bacillus velezensis]
MKKIVMTLFTVALLTFGIFSNSSEALAMTSKGAIKFQTDANTYSKHATSIVVTGTMSNHELNWGVTVFLENKKGKLVKVIDVNGHNIRSFKVSFLTKNIPAGKYDVQVASTWGTRTYIGELKHYITVQH